MVALSTELALGDLYVLELRDLRGGPTGLPRRGYYFFALGKSKAEIGV